MPFEYDVFISYAHADNEKPVGGKAQLGFVTTLAENVNRGVGVTKKKIFIDHQLQPGDAFGEDLRHKVANSAVLVILLSQNYVKSKWCGLELDHFIRTHSDDPSKPRDVFVVELTPFEQLQAVPQHIANLSKELLRIKFCFQPKDGANYMVAGDPSPEESGDPNFYWRQVNELTRSIDNRLAKLEVPREVSVHKSSSTSNGKNNYRVFLADVTDDLIVGRNNIRAALQAEGIPIVPPGDYVRYPHAELMLEMSAHLDQSLLFVQLLSATAGRSLNDWPAPIPRLQFDAASRVASNSQLLLMQWALERPQGFATDDHAELFDTPHLQLGLIENFKTEVIQRFKQQLALRAAASSPPAAAPTGGQRVVFVDDALADLDLGGRVAGLAVQHDCASHGTLQQPDLDDPLNVDALKDCQVGLTICPANAPRPNVRARLTKILKRAAELGLPRKPWGVYFDAQPNAGDLYRELGFVAPGVVAIPGTDRALTDFFRGIVRG